MSSHDAYREEPANLIAGLSGEFDLKYGLRLLWVGKSWIIVIALLGLGVGFLATFLQVPIYSARALVQIDPSGSKHLAAFESLSDIGVQLFRLSQLLQHPIPHHQK